MQSGEGLTSFDKHSSAYFSSETKKCAMKLSGVSIFENTRKQLNLSQISVDAATQRRMKHACFTKTSAPLIMIETH